ncbi:MAG: hypothetical protein KatS3mg107_0766 [Gemmataceae bacterium]|nr:MAG: hypothetical protein KatS3mg107_0766 [Gemmataceae bacterium]
MPWRRTPSKSASIVLPSGLHEALGLWVESNQVVYVVQRPELTRIRDANGDGLADEYAHGV